MPQLVTHLSVPDFPVAVERAMTPSLRERPIAAVRDLAGRARCVVLSDEAREHGIWPGMPLADARRRCPDLHTFYPDPDRVRRVTRALLERAGEFTPIVEPAGFGHVYLDVHGCWRRYGSPASAVIALCEKVVRELKIPMLAGLAGNKLVSVVAMRDAPPELLLEVERGGEKEYLAPQHPFVLPSVNGKLRHVMDDLNIRSVRDIQDLEPAFLLHALGLSAIRLMQEAQGIDYSQVLRPSAQPKRILAREFARETNDHDILHASLRALVVSALLRQREAHMCPRRLTVRVQYVDGREASASARTILPLSSLDGWLAAVGGLLPKAVQRRVAVRRLELLLTDFAPEELSLFDHSERQQRLLDALGRVRDRYGQSALSLGMPC